MDETQTSDNFTHFLTYRNGLTASSVLSI